MKVWHSSCKSWRNVRVSFVAVFSLSVSHLGPHLKTLKKGAEPLEKEILIFKSSSARDCLLVRELPIDQTMIKKNSVSTKEAYKEKIEAEVDLAQAKLAELKHKRGVTQQTLALHMMAKLANCSRK